MSLRTDLAIEAHEISGSNKDGINITEKTCGNLKISRISIKNTRAAEKLNKPVGRYITIEGLTLTDNFREVPEQIKIIADEIAELIPKGDGTVLVVGLGNVNITPDALGPKSASHILATRHITGEIARSVGLEDLRSVAVLSPGVLGQTGIEAKELISSLSDSLKPAVIIAVDALASRSLSRLGCTIQISDNGISPGAGVGNNRLRLDKDTIGVPVISIGVPTVVDAATLAADLLDDSSSEGLRDKVFPNGECMIVTPSEIDLLVERASELIGMSINCALQRNTAIDDLFSLVS